jgi:hypothetical protein
MLPRRLWIVAWALCLVLLPAFASASPGPKKHQVSFTTKFDAISLSGAQGAPGTKETDVGIRTGTIDGKSIGIGTLEDTGTWGPGLTFKSKGLSFDTHGSVRFTASLKGTPGAGGKLTFQGTLTVNGGTGRYKGAKATLQVTGSAPLGSDPDTGIIHSAGTATF